MVVLAVSLTRHLLPKQPNVSSLLALPSTVRTATYTLANARWQSTTPPKHPKTAIFFPGQGVQRVGMTMVSIASGTDELR